MTRFEQEINGGKWETNMINVIVNDLKNGGSFDAWISARSLSEIDSKIPRGYEMDKLTTLQNYFDHKTVNTYEIELMNSQYIYFAPFEQVYKEGFYRYTEALKKDRMSIVNKFDRLYQG